MDRYFTHPHMWIDSIPCTLNLTTHSMRSPKYVPLLVFPFPVHGFLCVEAGSLTIVFGLPVVSIIGLFSLGRRHQKCCLYLPHTFHPQRYFLDQILTHSSSLIIHFLLTPSFTMLPHWILLNVIHRSEHVTSLLINLKPPRSPYWPKNKSQLLSLYIQGCSTIWSQPFSNLPPPWKYCTLKLY